MIDVKARRKDMVKQIEVFGGQLPFLFTIGGIIAFTRTQKRTLNQLFKEIESDTSLMISLFYHCHLLGAEALDVSSPFEHETEFEVMITSADLEAMSKALEDSMPKAEAVEGNEKAAKG